MGVEHILIVIAPLPKPWDMGTLGTEGCKNQLMLKQHDPDVDIWMNQLNGPDTKHLEVYKSA